MGNNPFEYLWNVYAKTIVVIVGFFCFILCLNLIVRPYEKKHKGIGAFLSLVVFCYFLFLDVLIFDCTLFENQLVKNYIVSYTIQMLVFCIWHSKALRPFTLILLSLIVFNASIYLFKIHQSYTSDSFSFYGKMIHKPNIYLFILESYQGNEALKKLYHYDNTPFIDELKNMDFKVYEKVYSNAPNTRSSLSSVFSISYLNHVPENFIDCMLTKPYKYKVSNTFLMNGYEIEYIFPTAYLTQEDSRCRINSSNASLFSQKYFKTKNSPCPFHYNTFEAFIHAVEDYATEYRKKPFLFIAKVGGVSENDTTYSGGVTHIPNKYRHSNLPELLPDLRRNYITELEKENILLKTIIQKIVKQDPSGLVVLIGDHGSGFFEIYSRKYSGKINAFLHKNKIDKDDFMLDFYDILLAVKWPDYMKVDENIQMAPELFKIIFEKLIPDLKIPMPSQQFFDFEVKPLTDISLKGKE